MKVFDHGLITIPVSDTLAVIRPVLGHAILSTTSQPAGLHQRAGYRNCRSRSKGSRNITIVPSIHQHIPSWVFNRGNDVFVDTSDKTCGNMVCQKYLVCISNSQGVSGSLTAVLDCSLRPETLSNTSQLHTHVSGFNQILLHGLDITYLGLYIITCLLAL